MKDSLLVSIEDVGNPNNSIKDMKFPLQSSTTWKVGYNSSLKFKLEVTSHHENRPDLTTAVIMAGSSDLTMVRTFELIMTATEVKQEIEVLKLNGLVEIDFFVIIRGPGYQSKIWPILNVTISYPNPGVIARGGNYVYDLTPSVSQLVTSGLEVLACHQLVKFFPFYRLNINGRHNQTFLTPEITQLNRGSVRLEYFSIFRGKEWINFERGHRIKKLSFSSRTIDITIP